MKLNHFSPLKCAICGRNVCYEELPVCCECLSVMQELITERCLNCGRTAYACQCHDRQGLRFLFYYGSYQAMRLIYLVKTDVDTEFIDFLTELAVNACGVKVGSYDAVAFVPRPKKNRRVAGYDQAEQMAYALSRKYGIKVIDVIERVGGREQKLLSRAERMKNIKGIYRIKDGVCAEKYNKILIVDDIYTTGATMNTCAELLRGKIARAVVPFTLAKTNFRFYKGSQV